MQKIKYVYYVWVIISFVFLSVSFLSPRNKLFVSWLAADEILEDQIISFEQPDEDVRIFTIPGQEIVNRGDSLVFYTNHQYVKVYAEEEPVYSLDIEDKAIGNTVGAAWNFVAVPNDAKEVRVELTAIYPQSRGSSVVFYAGNGVSLYRMLMKQSFLTAFISILNLFLGVILIVFWAVFRKKDEMPDSLLYFGIFVVFLGMWAFTETDMAILLLLDSSNLLNMLSYLSLMLMPVPFVLFVRESLGIWDKWIYRLACIYSLTVTMVCMLLMLFHIADFKQTVLWVHLSLIIALGYMLYGISYKIYKKEFTRHVKINLIGMGIIVVSVLIELVTYYINPGQAGSIGQIGFLVYILILTGETVSDTIVQVDEGRKAVYYKQMASVDTLTGVYNRNAFMEDTSAIENLDGVYVVTFDLNDLKKTNDVKGHEAGDRYLVDSASAISYVFSQYGNCYRIGGDEFCVVIKEDTIEHVESLIARLKRCEEDYNQYSVDVDMKIACGYAVYDPEKDRNLEETRNRADARMYKNKREIKSGNNIEDSRI